MHQVMRDGYTDHSSNICRNRATGSSVLAPVVIRRDSIFLNDFMIAKIFVEHYGVALLNVLSSTSQVMQSHISKLFPSSSHIAATESPLVAADTNDDDETIEVLAVRKTFGHDPALLSGEVVTQVKNIVDSPVTLASAIQDQLLTDDLIDVHVVDACSVFNRVQTVGLQNFPVVENETIQVCSSTQNSAYVSVCHVRTICPSLYTVTIFNGLQC